MTWTLQQLADLTEGQLVGSPDLTITSMEQVEAARPGQLTFIRDDRYGKLWATSQASAAVVSRETKLEPGDGRGLIFVEDVDLAVAQVLGAMMPAPPNPPVGVHPSAVVDPTAEIAPSACIGPLCHVGARTVIGEGTVLHSHVSVLADSRIGAGCVLWPGVVVRERCRLGDRNILHPNVTIGADGFGYRPGLNGGAPIKIPQIGTVEIGHDVEVGAGTCIDRAKFSATVIGDGCKIDNLCQIAHNCRLGRSVILAGKTALAGSVTIGDHATVGGGTNVRDHVTIGAGATVYGASSVMNDVPPGETWGGYPARDAKLVLREHAALRKLPDLIKQLKKR